MSNVPQDLIEAATRKGIVPGAVVRCAYITSNTFTVPHWDEIEGEANISTVSLVDVYKDGGSKQRNYGYLKYGHTWATVIEPAPSQGLEEGMATECSPAMRAAIIELAKELGVRVSDFDPITYPHLAWTENRVWEYAHGNPAGSLPWTAHCWIPNHEFLARLEATAKKPKPIKIGEWNVKFEKGSIEVGCQRITNETVRAIAAKLKD